MIGTRGKDGPEPNTEFEGDDAELLGAADIRISPVRITAPYQIGLVLVAAAMLLLPLIYVALIGVLAASVAYHATHNTSILLESGSLFARIVGYIGPIVGGAAGVLFMIKPIFARAPRPPSPHVVSRADQPLLYAYVGALCCALGAPSPNEIHLDMQVNASASFRRGITSMFGRDLVLTLGLPLVSGLTISQFSGVLAHEFGHFTQAVAMRLSYLIATVNHWFARVVYERDEWDQGLATLRKEARIGYVQLVIFLAIVCVWLSRRVLWVLMHVGHALSAYLSRQMEFNADRYYVQVVGSGGFRSTYLRIGLMEAAFSAALTQVEDMWSEGRLAENLPAISKFHAEHLEKDVELATRIEKGMVQHPTRIFDTHPSGADRIARAERNALPPKIALTESATTLFRNFESLAASSSRSFYEVQLGDEAKGATLVPTEEIEKEFARVQDAGRAAARIGLGGPLLSFGVAPRLDRLEPTESFEDSLAAVHSARDRSLGAQLTQQQTLEPYDAAYQEKQRLDVALTLKRAGIRFSTKDLNVPTTDMDELRALLRKAEQRRANARREVETAFPVIQERVEAAVRLLKHPGFQFDLSVETDAESYRSCFEVISALTTCWQQQSTLATQHHQLLILASEAEKHVEDEAFQNEAGRILTEIRDLLTHLFERLHETAFPFEHERAPLSVAQHAMQGDPPRDLAILDYVGQAIDRLGGLYWRCWGELATLVEAVEAAVGLPPLEIEQFDSVDTQP